MLSKLLTRTQYSRGLYLIMSETTLFTVTAIERMPNEKYNVNSPYHSINSRKLTSRVSSERTLLE